MFGAQNPWGPTDQSEWIGIGQWSLSHNKHGRFVTCAMAFRAAVLGVVLGELIKALGLVPF